MNKLKLRHRFAPGFGALIAIALFLGGYAALEMNFATRQPTTMSKAKVPEVTVATLPWNHWFNERLPKNQQ